VVRASDESVQVAGNTSSRSDLIGPPVPSRDWEHYSLEKASMSSDPQGMAL
jgi:hypothetical protein